MAKLKRLVSFLLAAVLVFTSVPLTTFAAYPEDTEDTAIYAEDYPEDAEAYPRDAEEVNVYAEVMEASAEMTAGGDDAEAVRGAIEPNGDAAGDLADVNAAKAGIESIFAGVILPLQEDTETADGVVSTHIIGRIEEIVSKYMPISYEVKTVGFTPAKDEWKAPPKGVEGSYTFTVELKKNSASAETGTLTLVILPGPLYGDKSDIASFRYLIENEIFDEDCELDQEEAETQADVEAYIKGSISNWEEDFPLNGIKYTVSIISFTPAVAGTVGSPDGSDGSCRFRIHIEKGEEADSTGEITLIIRAVSQDANDVVAAGDMVAKAFSRMYDSGRHQVRQDQANTEEAVVDYVGHALADVLVELEQNDINWDIGAYDPKGRILFWPAEEGTADKTEGTNGQCPITIRLTKGKAVRTINRLLIIAATPDSDWAAELISGLTSEIESRFTAYKTTYQCYVDTEETAKTYIASRVKTQASIYARNHYNKRNINIDIEVEITGFSAPTAGAAGAVNGTDGSCAYTVTLSLGSAAATTKELGLSIIATKYDPEGDLADVNEAREKIEQVFENGFLINQEEIESAEDAYDRATSHIEEILSSLDLIGVFCEIETIGFTLPKNKDQVPPDGENGFYTFTVSLSKNAASAVTGTLAYIILSEGTYNNKAAVAELKMSIEEAFYDGRQAEQSELDTERKVKAYVDGIIYEIITGHFYGTSTKYTINTVSFSKAVAGTEDDQDGSDGSYLFDVDITQGSESARTATLTLVLEAMPYGGEELPDPDKAAIQAAMKVIQNSLRGCYVRQEVANTEEEVVAYITSQLAGMELNGVECNVGNSGRFVAAEEGNASKPEGSNGQCGVWISLEKGNRFAMIRNITLTIVATPDSDWAQTQVNEAKTGLEARLAASKAHQVYVNSEEDAKTILERRVEKQLATYMDFTIDISDFSEPTAGTEIEEEGTDGSCDYTVTLSRGSASATTQELTLSIIATKYDPAGDLADINAVKGAIEQAFYEDISIPRSVWSDANEVENAAGAYIEETVDELISDLDLIGVFFEVNQTGFTSAVKGTADNQGGTDGSYQFTVALRKGGQTGTTKDLALTIKAAPYGELGRLKDMIEEAFNSHTARQEEVDDLEDYLGRMLGGLIKESGLTGVGFMVTEEYYAEPRTGDEYHQEGRDGWYDFRVELYRYGEDGEDDEIIDYDVTDILSLTIAATSYGRSSIVMLKADIEEMLEWMFSEPRPQAYVNTEEAAKDLILNTISELVYGDPDDNGEYRRADSAVVNTVEYKAAIAGTESSPDGTDGYFRYTITLTGGLDSITTQKFEISIRATAYDVYMEKVRELIERTSYKMDQERVITASDANEAMSYCNDYLAEVINQMLSDDPELGGTGIDAAVYTFAYTQALAGSRYNPGGRDGSCKFIVELRNDEGVIQRLEPLTMTIAATMYGTPEEHDADIAAAKTAVENGAYGPVKQTDVNTQEAAEAYVNDVIDRLNRIGVFHTVNSISFTAAVSGTASNPNGTNGSYTFTATLRKGAGTPQTTDELSLAITATQYSPDQDNADIAAAKAVVEGTAYGPVEQTDVDTQEAAKAYVEGVINGLSLNGVSYTVNSNSFTVAVKGTASSPNGTDGSYEFTVTLSKGSGTPQTTGTQTVTITAALYDQNQDNTDITAAKAAVGGAAYGPVEQANVDTQEAAKAYVEGVIDGLSLNGVSYTINNSSYTAAVRGTTSNLSGTNGSYKFTVTLSKGGGTPQTTDTLTLTITAMPYDPSQDNADIAAAKAMVGGAAYGPVEQADVNTQEAAEVYVEEVINGLSLNGVSYAVNAINFTAAEKKTLSNPSGTNGSYEFTVTLSKGGGTPQTTDTLTVTITATVVALQKLTISEKQLNMKADDPPKQLAVEYTPNDTPQREIVWSSNNTSVAMVDNSGKVTAIAPGSATIEARSVDNNKIYDFCWVTVTSPPNTDIIFTSDPASLLEDGRILDTYQQNKTILLAANQEVTWKSSDTKVAAIDREGRVTYKSSGTVIITATTKTSPKKSADVVLTIRDTTPKLPVSTITVNTNTDGTAFAVLPSDNFEFADIEMVNFTDIFELSQVTPTLYSLKAKEGAQKRTYGVELQAKGAGGPVGNRFSLSVKVVTDIPKAAVKMPALNTFWKEASAQIEITGKDLPEIVNVELVDLDNSPEKVTENFEVTKDGLIRAKEPFGSFTDSKNTKPAVKGKLRIYYEGYGNNYHEANITVSVKKTVPKLTLKPTVQTINPTLGFDAGFEVTGGEISDAKLKDGVAANANFEVPMLSGNTIIMKLKDSVINHKKAQTFVGQIDITLAGARDAITVKPTVKTVKTDGGGTAVTYKLSVSTVTLNSILEEQKQTVLIVPSQANAEVNAVEITSATPDGGIKVEVNAANKSELSVTVPKDTAAGQYRFSIKPDGIAKPLVLTVKMERKTMTATVKAEKGNIDLVNRNNTLLTYVPTIKNTAHNVKNVSAVVNNWTKTGTNPNADDYKKFDVTWNGETQKVEVKAKDGQDYQRGASYKLRFEFELDSGDKVNTADITIKPAQSTVKHNLPKSLTMYQSRTSVENYIVIDLKPLSPDGAKIKDFGFKQEKNDLKPTNNPNNAYWYIFDPENQELRIWIIDGALVKPGKVNLVFSVTYVGQGLERNTGSPKQFDLKLPVNIVK